MRKLLIGAALAATVVAGTIAVPAVTTTAPANAGPIVCHDVRILHTKPNCDRAVRICGYYTYSRICD